MNVTETNRPIVNVTGERVALGPLRRDLAPHLLRWWNDFPTARLAGFPDPPAPWTVERVAGWLDEALADQQRVGFTVYSVDGPRPIGYANLRDIDHQHGTAEFGITIGDPADRGRGYGTEAVRLILDYAFTALGLTNVLLDTVEFNQAGQRAYEKAGFHLVGRRRRSVSAGGQRWDVIFMDCLASDVMSPVLTGVLRETGGRR